MLTKPPKIRSILVFAVVALLAQTGAAAAADTSWLLKEYARECGEVGHRMADSQLANQSRCLLEQIPAEVPELTRENQRRLRGALDRIAFLKRGLPERIAPENQSLRRAEDWPQADCTIAAEDQASFAELLAEIGTATAAELTLILAEEGCYGPKVEPVVSTGLVVNGECAGFAADFGGGEGTIWVDKEAVIEWNMPAGAMNNPTLCVPLIAALQTAEFLAAQTAAYLGCWKGAYVDANYDRLEVLRDEIKELQEEVEFLTALEVETQLQIWSGSRIAYLYLPEELGGIAEDTTSKTESAFENTKAAGYIIHPRVQNRLTEANDKEESGDLKKAFDLYMKVYRDSTAKSPRRLP
jgi:hypothetical protein